jgi:hypothetical protein
MIWNTELKIEYKGTDLRPFEALSQNFPGEVTKAKTFRMGMFEPPSPEYKSSFYLLLLLTYWLPIPVQGHMCCLYKTCLAFYVLRVTAENVGLHAGNTKFITKKEE